MKCSSQHQITRPRPLQFGLRTLLLAMLVAAIISSLVGWSLRKRKAIERLLRSDDTFVITELVVEGQQRKFVCNHASTLQEIRKAFSNANSISTFGGLCYNGKISFDDIALPISFGMEIDGHCFALSLPDVSEPIEPGWPTHLLEFSRPISPNISAMCEFLNDDSDEAQGKVLLINSDGTIHSWHDNNLIDP